MKRNKTPLDDDVDPSIQEAEDLEAYLELGMVKDAMPLARKLLERRPLSPREFGMAVQTVTLMTPRQKAWVPWVEAAYTSMTKRDQASADFHMLAFYANLSDWSKAILHVSQRPTSPGALTLTMYTLLNLRNLPEAKRNYKRCMRALRRTTDPYSRSMLLDALADYHAQTGALDSAAQCWQASPSGEAFSSQAAVGLVKLQAAKGLHCVAAALRGIAQDRLQNTCLSDLKPRSGGKRPESKTERELRKYRAAFERIVPRKEMWKFGLDPINDGNHAPQ